MTRTAPTDASAVVSESSASFSVIRRNWTPSSEQSGLDKIRRRRRRRGR